MQTSRQLPVCSPLILSGGATGAAAPVKLDTGEEDVVEEFAGPCPPIPDIMTPPSPELDPKPVVAATSVPMLVASSSALPPTTTASSPPPIGRNFTGIPPTVMAGPPGTSVVPLTSKYGMFVVRAV